MSRACTRVRVRENEVLIDDSDSKNGTWVNGARITEPARSRRVTRSWSETAGCSSARRPRWIDAHGDAALAGVAVSRIAKPARNTGEPSRPIFRPCRSRAAVSSPPSCSRRVASGGGARGGAAGPGAAPGRVRRAPRPAVRPAPPAGESCRRVLSDFDSVPGAPLAGRRAREQGRDRGRPPRLPGLQRTARASRAAHARRSSPSPAWAAAPSSSARGPSSAWRSAIPRSRRWSSSTRRSTRSASARTLRPAARSRRGSRSVVATGRPPTPDAVGGDEKVKNLQSRPASELYPYERGTGRLR